MYHDIIKLAKIELDSQIELARVLYAGDKEMEGPPPIENFLSLGNLRWMRRARNSTWPT